MGNHLSPEVKEAFDAARESRVLQARNLNLQELPDSTLPDDLLEAFIDFNALKKLPDTVKELKSLKTLSASGIILLFDVNPQGNRLVQLPKKLSKIRTLQNLDLSFNRLNDTESNWQRVISKCESLEELDLSYNALISIDPATLKSLLRLRKLSLEGNRLETLPPLQTLLNLTHLNLRGNSLTSLPSEIGLLVNLSELNLSDNKLTSIPPSLSQLTNLRALLFYQNALPSLPSSLTTLTGLRSINLYHNELTSLPPLNEWKLVTRLTVSQNALEEIPEGLTEMQSLGVLHLDHNRFVSAPSFAGNFESLHTLHLSYNRLTSLPDSFACLESLKILRLNWNKLTREGLDVIWKLKNLAEINLAFNEIATLPPDIGGLVKLRYLNLSYNQISTLPPSIITCFQDTSFKTKENVLILSYNNFTSFPVVLTLLKGLEELHFGGNFLSELPPQIGELSDLLFLSLANNKTNLKIPSEIIRCQKLKKLHLFSPGVEVTLPREINLLTSLGELDIGYNNPWPTSINEQASILHVPDRPTPIANNLRFGVASLWGSHDEDILVVEGSIRPSTDYFATFDGHGGKSVAEFCSQHFHPLLSAKLEIMSNAQQALKETFGDINAILLRDYENGKLGVKAGSAALVALVSNGDLIVGNLGDSHAVFASDSKVEMISQDHKVGNLKEIDRVVEMGGMVVNDPGGGYGYRVCKPGETAIPITRSLGDFSISPVVSCDPYVVTVEGKDIKSGDILILACDGVWDVLSPSEAVAIVRMESHPMRAAIRLRDAAYALQSNDDISVVVVFFDGPFQAKKERKKKPVSRTNSIKSSSSSSSISRKSKRSVSGNPLDNLEDSPLIFDSPQKPQIP